jgi:hypothetical protein
VALASGTVDDETTGSTSLPFAIVLIPPYRLRGPGGGTVPNLLEPVVVEDEEESVCDAGRDGALPAFANKARGPLGGSFPDISHDSQTLNV